MTKRKQETNKKIAQVANTSLQDKLRTLKIAKVEAKTNRGVNPSRIMTLEDRSRAIFRPASGELAGQDSVERKRKIRLPDGKMSMTDFEKARHLFREAGLDFPTIPEVLAARLKEQGKWLFSTRLLQMSPYNLRHYVQEVDERHVEDYAVLCHSGHGVNSYAIQYYLVYGPLRMFLFLGWGGVYMDADAAASKIRECFSLADEIVQAVMTVKEPKAGERVTIVGSDFYGSYWFLSGQSRQKKRLGLKSPAEILTEVLHWLKSPAPSC